MGVAPEKTKELAAAAAARVVGHLEGERLIPRFIDSYVMGFDRRQLKQPPDRFLDRSNQLGREALLLLGRLTVEKCGERFQRLKLGPLKLRDASAARQFAEAFWAALVAELKLEPEAAAGLGRQAEDYADRAERKPRFAARVAPLLDPAPQMKDKAEHAGHKFYEALEQVAQQVANRLLGRP